MDNTLIVVDDLDAAIAFFTELGMELDGRTEVAGQWAARICGFDDQRVDVAMMKMPDGHGRIELSKFHTPPAVTPDPRNARVNTLGFQRVMFAVDDLDDVIARLRAHGADLVGTVEQYEDVYRLCYLRHPEGFIIGLAEQLN